MQSSLGITLTGRHPFYGKIGEAIVLIEKEEWIDAGLSVL
jgi:hypothetical protein